ncbi:acetyltransferase (GNAT) family protein [Paenibacillus cellulosilyticus]|uniref:Acetyltransferase (GNAT) family protein n=1 Tax=Paenibacillus cellulosilyticus TaxID=375489 RepID=A0A2V2YT12_9BACL|nr:GNAT family N-acetyltransferase [Paenibacillus cellulosilyticus]PWW02399.1 acetyltransferase (GNAT) family protein [Paenibacillus cellulosilyticus]QKS47111.1 GNAT family N-acetyltransferase [Paenibacillus cellulosilyticus]
MSIQFDASEFTIISDYKNDEILRKSFNQLANDVFGIDFEHWFQKGFWDHNYICHSVVINQQVVSNVSINKMNLIIDGTNQRAIQIGTVMTHPDYRGNGLSGALMKHVLEAYQDECEVFYLFANDSVHQFYPKFGFAPYTEANFSMKAAPISIVNNGLRQIDCANEEDLQRINKILRTRTPVSNRFGISDNQGIFMFYALNVFQDSIYLMEDEEAIIVYRNEGNVLHLYDVVSKYKVDLARLLSHISNRDTETIQFHFTPDRFTDNVNVELKGQGDLLFVKSKTDLNLSFALCAPLLSHA